MNALKCLNDQIIVTKIRLHKMANVICRRFLFKIQRIREFSNLAAYPCTNIFLAKHYKPISTFRSRHEIKLTVLYLPKRCDIVYYSTNTKSDQNEHHKKDKKDKELTLFQKFKIMYRDYWYVLLPVHILTSTVWFGTFYYMAKSGIDIVKLLESLHVSEQFVNPLRDSSMGYFAVAYALYKIFTPARYTVTLGGTTVSINYLRKWGYIKPVPSKERMKEIIQEKKETLTKSVQDTKEGIIETKANLMETVRETKEGIIEKRQNIIESLHDAKEEIMEKKGHVMGGVKDAKSKSKRDAKGDCKGTLPKVNNKASKA